MLRRRGWWAGLVAGAVAGSTLVGVPAAASTVVVVPVCPRVVSVENYAAVEGNPTAGPTTTKTTRFVFRVTSSGCAQAGAVAYWTVEAQARDSKDFVGTTGTLIFAAGDMNAKIIVVDVIIDALMEKNESFTVGVCPAAGVLDSGHRGVGTIVNDDVVPPEEPSTGTIPELHCSE